MYKTFFMTQIIGEYTIPQYAFLEIQAIEINCQFFNVILINKRQTF